MSAFLQGLFVGAMLTMAVDLFRAADALEVERKARAEEYAIAKQLRVQQSAEIARLTSALADVQELLKELADGLDEWVEPPLQGDEGPRAATPI